MGRKWNDVCLQKQKEYRETLKAKGLCIYCRSKNVARPGKVSCQKCVRTQSISGRAWHRLNDSKPSRYAYRRIPVNRERHNATNQAWDKANPEKAHARITRYREKHRDRVRARKRASEARR